MKTLKETMPESFVSDSYGTKAYEYRDVEVVKEYYRSENGFKEWLGKHKNVHFWVVLENSVAVGFNENPARGYSYPVKSIKNS